MADMLFGRKGNWIRAIEKLEAFSLDSQSDVFPG
jgi:hypothetical protein